MQFWDVQLGVQVKCGDKTWSYIVQAISKEEATYLAKEAYKKSPYQVVKEPTVRWCDPIKEVKIGECTVLDRGYEEWDG